MTSLRQLEPADACWDYDDVTTYADKLSGVGAEVEDRQRRDRLTKTIESEIIPRLLLAFGGDRSTAESPATPARLPDGEDVQRFARSLLGADSRASRAFVDAARERGVPLEAIFLDLFAPAARYLGDLWSADLCDFVDVTMGLSRLQQLLRTLAPVFEAESEVPLGGRRVLLIPAPGEQHTFGLAIVEEFFRRAGWEVWVEAPTSPEELGEFLRGMWFGVVGLSVSGDLLLEPLAAAIRSIRRESLNRCVGVMVGGRIFVEKPELVALVGADATAADARLAVRQSEALLGLVASRS